MKSLKGSKHAQTEQPDTRSRQGRSELRFIELCQNKINEYIARSILYERTSRTWQWSSPVVAGNCEKGKQHNVLWLWRRFKKLIGQSMLLLKQLFVRIIFSQVKNFTNFTETAASKTFFHSLSHEWVQAFVFLLRKSKCMQFYPHLGSRHRWFLAEKVSLNWHRFLIGRTP